MNAASVVRTIIASVNTQTLLAVLKKIELYALSGSGDAQTTASVCIHARYESPSETLTA